MAALEVVVMATIEVVDIRRSDSQLTHPKTIIPRCFVFYTCHDLKSIGLVHIQNINHIYTSTFVIY